MIVDVDLIVFNCIFSRAVNLNRCFIDKIILHHGTYIFYFFEKKTPGCPGGFTEDAPSAQNSDEISVCSEDIFNKSAVLSTIDDYDGSITRFLAFHQ